LLLRPLSAAGIAFALLASCAQPPPVLDQIRERGQLRVATLNQPTSYYLGAQGAQGFEYRLASAFAARLNVQLVIMPVRDLTALHELVSEGSADLAAAQLGSSEEWKRVALPSTVYRRVSQLVVQRRGTKPVRNITALRGARLVVRTGSPQLQSLRDMRGGGAPYLTWTELPREQANPLDWVASGDADFAIVDADEFQFARHLNPEVIVAFTLPDPRPLQWMVRRDALELRDAVNGFFADATRSGLLARLEKEARAEVHDFEYLEAQRYQEDILKRLPELRSWFEEAGNTNDLDWRLLAAVGYQESKWQARAASDDGAAGIMMLTTSTAEAVGVKNRNDPRQSIVGGAAYLAQVMKMIPPRVPEPDRTWLALAAYNVGYGHLEDARVLAQAHGRNPDSWDDVSKYLPLLAQEQWFTQAKRGYARGWEPVKFVEQVRGFLSVLEWLGTDASSDLALTPVMLSTPLKELSK
jgi:membrane-bound lytic murein transglycosylase F